MRVPIPDDWNGQDWVCIQVEWPNSTHWIGLLTGILTLLTRGRYWDERTGSIKDAQEIAFEIFRRSYPYISCSDGEIAPPDSDFTAGAIQIMQEEIMSLCGYNPNAFKIEDGVFYVKNFCGEWTEIGPTGLTATPPIDDELEWPSESTFSACGKAWAITNLVQNVGNTIWDQKDNDPVSGWSNVDQAYPQIMSMGWTINAIAQASIINLLIIAGDDWYGPELFDESTWQSITCQLKAHLDDTETLPDKDTLFALMLSLIQVQWPLDPLAIAFWADVMKAIGENDMRNAGLGGATDTGRDCGCPQGDTSGPTDPVSGGWYLGAAVDLSAFYVDQFNTKLGYKTTPEHDVYGCAFVQTITGDRAGMNVKRMNPANCGVSNYDIAAWGDTSDNLQYEVNGTQFACGEVSVLNLLFGVGNYFGLSSTLDSAVIPVPGMVGGLTCAFGWYMDGADEGEGVEYEFRLIHNVNSPSHS